MIRPYELGTNEDGRYRVVDEVRIVGNLVRALWPCEAADDLPGATAHAMQLLERWVRAGLPCRVVDGQRLFDPCEAGNFALAAWLRDGDPVWRDHQLASSRRLVSDLQEWASHATTLVVAQRREFNLHGIDTGAMLRLRAPLPLRPEPVDSICTGPADSTLHATHSAMPGRLEMRAQMPSPALPTAWVETSLHVACTPSGIAITDDMDCAPCDTASPEYRLYTRDSEGLVRTTPAVRAVARSLAGPQESAPRVLRRIWDYFATHMKLGSVHYSELDPDDPLGTLLARRWCDCHLGSSLFVALARARGIPARVVTGAMLYPVAPSAQHSWLEVLLPPHGWLPVDLTGVVLAGYRLDDSQWGGHFLGHLDARVIAQRLPREFVGPVGVKVPAEWYLIDSLAPPGVELTLGCLDERGWVYRDRIRVSPQPDAAVQLVAAS